MSPSRTLTVVVRGNGRETAAADSCHACTLRSHPAPRLGVVRRGDELLLAFANLERERALAGFGEHFRRLETVADLDLETQPVEAAGGEDDRVETPLGALGEPRVDVPAQWLDGQRGLEREQLRSAPRRCCADTHPRRQAIAPDERVARILARRVRADDEPSRVGRRHVLRRMNGDVDAAAQQGFLELLHEDAALTDLAERLAAVAVADRRDRDESDLDGSRGAQQVGRETGLREREPTAASADAKQHRREVSSRSVGACRSLSTIRAVIESTTSSSAAVSLPRRPRARSSSCTRISSACCAKRRDGGRSLPRRAPGGEPLAPRRRRSLPPSTPRRRDPGSSR